LSFEDWSLSAWGRWLPRRRSKGADDAAPEQTRPVGLGDSIVAMRRDLQIHSLLVAEMERRGPETTADDLYDEVAAAWDRAHATPPASEPRSAADAPPTAGSRGTPHWAQHLLHEQRETNRLLTELLESLRRDRR